MLAVLWNTMFAAARTQTVLHGRAREGQPAKPRDSAETHPPTLDLDSLHSAKDVGGKRIAAETGVRVGTIYRVDAEGSEIREKVF